METVNWIEWEDINSKALPPGRVYIGTECCETLLPDTARIIEYAKFLTERGHALSLVTPFVSENGLERVNDLFGRLGNGFPNMEIICNDWGVFNLAAEYKNFIPVIGRLLVRQDTDPRFSKLTDKQYQGKWERDVLHADGTIARLKYQRPGDSMLLHTMRVSLDSPELLNYLDQFRVNRFEVNNLLQGIKLKIPDNWSVSLHIPATLVAVARRCNNLFYNQGIKSECNPLKCSEYTLAWEHKSFPVPLYHHNNALYYLNDIIPGDCGSLGIDRIIVRRFFSKK